MAEKTYLGPQGIIEKKKKYIMPCLAHFYKEPRQFVRGSMQYLYDSEGKKYLDCFAGVSVINCGHCNPEINKKVTEQVNTLQHVCNIYLTENFVNLAEKLAEVTPGNLQKSFFCSTGTEANEGAALLAQIYTGKSEFIALKNGLHGRTKLTMSLTGIGMWRTDPNPVGGINFAPNPYCYRCPLGKKHPECNLACADAIEDIIKTATSGQPAAFISTAEIADTYTRPGASTLGGNPVSSTAGLAVLEYIEDHKLMENANTRGEQLRKGLKELQQKHPIIGDIRGLGLMDGAEFVKPDGSPAPEELDSVLEAMKYRGFIIGKNGIGRNVMAFQPPLVITEEDINEVLNALDMVLTEQQL